MRVQDCYNNGIVIIINKRMRIWENFDSITQHFKEKRKNYLQKRNFKLILMLFCLSLLIDYHISLNIKCSIIGITACTLLVFEIITEDNQRKFNFWEFKKYEKLFLVLGVILALDVRYSFWISLGVMLCYFISDYLHLYWSYKNKKHIPQSQKSTLIYFHIAAFYYQLLLFRYQDYISMDWFYLLLPFLLLIILGIFLIFLTSLCFVITSGFRFSIGGEQDEDDSDQQKIALRRYNALLFIVYYFNFFLLIGNIYFSSFFYQKMLIAMTAFNTIESALFHCLDRRAFPHFHRDFFYQNTLILNNNQWIKRSIYGDDQPPILNSQILYPKCMLCSNNSSLVHQQCHKFIACLECFQKMKKNQQLKIKMCPYCHQSGVCFYVYHRQEIKQQGKQEAIFDFLQEGEVLFSRI